MEVSSLSAESPLSEAQQQILPLRQYNKQFVRVVRNKSRGRRKRVQLQPSPRTPASMSPPPVLDPTNTAGETGNKAQRVQHVDLSSLPAAGRPRRTTAQSDIQEAILHPGNVRINVQGAFIVDEEQPGTPQSEDYEHDPKDIRLPNHTAVVSHIAVDVSMKSWSCALLTCSTRSLRAFSSVANILTTMLHRLEVHLQSSSTSRAGLAMLLAADSTFSNSRQIG